nr:MAG TPA: hypothetical protein [Caudoviricetes sp.]
MKNNEKEPILKNGSLFLILLLLLLHYWYQYSNKIPDNRHKAVTGYSQSTDKGCQ